VFTIGFGSAFCSFSINATGAGTGPGGGGGINPNLSDTAWQFTEGTKIFKGFFDTVYTQTATGVGTVLSLEGYTSTNYDTAMYIDILLPGSTVQPGTYFTISTAGFAVEKDTTTLYEADPTTQGTNMQIVITSYDSTTKIVIGTFSGTAKTSTGAVVTITNGRFKGRLN
jgi:hypothetical protein